MSLDKQEIGALKEVEVTEEEVPTEVVETTEPETLSISETEAVQENEVVVTIGDEEPPKEESSQAPEWVRELRKSHRETQKENKELRARLESLQNPVKPVVQKPKLEDFDYDTDEYEKALTVWFDQKREADAKALEIEKDQRSQAEAWQRKLAEYGAAKQSLKVKDFDDVEAVVLETLSETQQGIIVHGADNSALVVYALGSNPNKAKELAQIKDPVKFAFAVAKLEKDLKIRDRKAPPPPERTVSGTAPKSGVVDSNLERLRVEAEKTGDYTKVSQYRQKLRAKT